MGRAFIVPGADFSANNLGTITPSDDIELYGLSIVGPTIAYGTAQYTPSYTPAWTTKKDVTWSIVSGGSYASITNAGLLVVNEGVTSQNVTIRCTSSDNNSVYAEKTINVSYEAVFTPTDYIQNTGSSYLILDDFAEADMYGATIESRGSLSNGNGYLISYRNDTNNTAMRFAHYRQSAGATAYLLGTSDFHGVTGQSASSYVWRYVFVLSSSSSAKDASLAIYKEDAETPVFTIASGTYKCYMSGSLMIFALGYTPHGGPNEINESTIGKGKFYGATITKNGSTVAEYVPGSVNGIPCIKNTVNGKYFFDITNNGDLVAGNDA